MKDLNEMTVTELLEYKQKLYKDNTDNGNILKLKMIARVLGDLVPHNYGPKYLYKNGDIEIYVDDYGGYGTVHVGGKLKVSTHTEQLYAPGEWESIIETEYPKAQSQLDAEKKILDDETKNDILNQLL